MPDLWMRKNLNQCLEPADDMASEYLRNVKIGEMYLVNIRKPRNLQFHRKFMALIKIAWDNQERYDAFEAVRKEVTMRAGFFTEHHHLTGRVSYEAKSISFAAMDELQFTELYSKSIDVILQHFMPPVDQSPEGIETSKAELEQAVERVLGFSG